MMERSEREKEETSNGFKEKNIEEDEDNKCSILQLPEECLAHAISLTTPADACRSSAVSAAFHAAASSDAVWECFLPPGYHSILDRADDPVDLTTSKKELFLDLAQDHVLLDQRAKSFWLERTSGAKCYMLSHRSLYSTWQNNPLYWRQIYSPNSRFEEVRELIAVCWFDVYGRIDCTELSPNTNYAAYLVFNLADESYGLDCPAQVAYIAIDGGRVLSPNRTISLHPSSESQLGISGPIRDRGDGWMEIQLGEFYNQQEDTGMILIHLAEHIQLNWKKGLLVEGIEIRQN